MASGSNPEWYTPRIAAAINAFWGACMAIQVAALAERDFEIAFSALFAGYGSLFGMYIAYYLPWRRVRRLLRVPRPRWTIRVAVVGTGAASLSVSSLWLFASPFDLRPSAVAALLGVTVLAVLLFLPRPRTP